MEREKNANRNLVGKPEGNFSLEWPRPRREGIIKKQVKERGCVGVEMESSDSRWGPMAGRGEPSVFIRCDVFLDYFSYSRGILIIVVSYWLIYVFSE
jgi:hypothetical protein